MYETDVSAQCAQTRQDPWFPEAHVDQGRPCGHPLAEGQGAPPAFGLSSAAPRRRPAPGRIRSRRSFIQLRRTQAKGRSGPITVAFVEKGTPEGGPSAGYAVGRRVGTAVTRNRLRRRLRALVTELVPDLPDGAYLVSAGPGAVSLTAAELGRDLRRATQRAITHRDENSQVGRQ